jgi:peroxiredoxin Q/BCP
MTIEIGDAAPPFDLTSDEGHSFGLEDAAGSRLVIYFYPKAFTPGCTGESCDFRDRHETFQEAGYQIVGVSPDDPETPARFRQEHDLPFSLLSDPDHAVAAAYGAWGIKKNYGKEYEGLIRSTFIIDRDGVVEQAWRNVRAKGHVERVERTLA